MSLPSPKPRVSALIPVKPPRRNGTNGCWLQLTPVKCWLGLSG